MGRLEHPEKSRRSGSRAVDGVAARPDAVAARPAEAAAVPVGPQARPRLAGASDPIELPYPMRFAAAWAWRLLVLGLATVAGLWLLARLQLVVVPLTIALLLSALLAPAVARLRRAGLPASLASAIVLVAGLAAVVGTLTLVINEFVDGAPDLSRKASEGVQRIENWLKNGPLHLTETELNNLLSNASSWLQNHRDAVTSGALSTASTLTHVLAGIFLVLFATFFFLRDGRRISGFLISMWPQHARDHLAGAAEAAWNTLGAYVRATVLVAFIDAVGIGLVLFVLRVPFWFPLAALVFLGAFVPIIGATLSGAVAVLVALVTRNPVIALIVLGAVIGVQQLEGHVLQPLIMGRAVAIHPLAVILAIATGVVVAGVVGALVAVPVVAVLNTGARHLIAVRRAQEAGLPPPGPPEPTGPPAPPRHSTGDADRGKRQP